MRYIWLFWLPLLFLPNAGREQATTFGTLTLADFLIGPYLIFAFLGGYRYRGTKLRVNTLLPLMVAFLWWATFSTLSILVRYDYTTNHQVLFGLLKLAKFSLYGTAGILTVKALARKDGDEPTAFYWSILAAGCLVGLLIILTGNQSDPTAFSTNDDDHLYLDNGTSGLLAILITYIAGLVLAREGSVRWRQLATLGLLIMALSLIQANGRGGWLAAIAGIVYLLFSLSKTQFRRVYVTVPLGIVLFIILYTQFASFREEVDRTIHPDVALQAYYDGGIFGIDDGGRLAILLHEMPRVFDTPLLGHGFFHRGGLSGIYGMGSHNFYLQIFLETGLPGGFLILFIFWSMWRHASIPGFNREGPNIPVRSALFAAFVLGLSGEYFYGGTILFVLFLVYAPVGSIPAQQQEAMGSPTISPQKARIHTTQTSRMEPQLEDRT
jgi:hypothetical protein